MGDMDNLSVGFAGAAEIVLEDGIFAKSAETGINYIRSVDPDRLLAPCFEVHGLDVPNNKMRYEGWEREGANNWAKDGGEKTYTLAGHSLGHWMSAASAFVAETRDKDIAKMLEYTVSRLDELQTVSGSSYIGGVYEDVFTRMFNGDVHWFDGYWVPWYGIHKIYQGLIDAYVYADNKTALKVVTKFCDWAVDGLEKLSYRFMQEALNCEYGGMNEVFAEMFGITGNERYLKAARYFTQDIIIEPLVEDWDQLTGNHANTTIPKLIGAAVMYEQMPEKYVRYRSAAENFWDIVVNDRSYAIGGNSIAEHFEAMGAETLGVKTCESCNTYNMLKLTEHLYSWDHDVKYMDYYENALYNHILGQQDPVTGSKMYFTSLLQGHHRIYEEKNKSWWCCTGTGMENPGRYTRTIYYKENDSLYINLYIPTSFSWKEKGLKVSMKTEYPYSDKVYFSVTEGKAEAELKFRAPSWIDSEMTATINDKVYKAKGGEYLTIKREWHAGDEIEINIPMSIQIHRSRDKNRIVYKYGFVALAAELDKLDGVEGVQEYITNETLLDTVVSSVPYIITDGADPKELISCEDRDSLIFKLNGKNMSDGQDRYLRPFYTIHHSFHNVYWDLDKDADRYEKELNKVTVDVVEPDGQQDEIGHMLVSKNSNQGSFTVDTRTFYWRDAYGTEDSFFGYTMKVDPNVKYLFVRYCDAPSISLNMRREFNIMVDGKLLVNQRVFDKAEDVCDMFYELPDMSGKVSIDIKFVPKNSMTRAGIVSEIRTVTGKII